MLNFYQLDSKVLEEWQETEDVKVIRIAVPSDFLFNAAQYVSLELKIGDQWEAKVFSIASSPQEKQYIDIAKKLTGSVYSDKFKNLKREDQVKIKGPFGNFLLDEKKDTVMISGGIGVTPLKCMISNATEKKLPIKISLLFGNRTEQIPFKKEIDNLAKENPNFYVKYFVEQPSEQWQGQTGRITKERVMEIENYKEKIFYLCGPPAMVNGIVEMLKEAGVPEKQIRMERFTGLTYDKEKGEIK